MDNINDFDFLYEKIKKEEQEQKQEQLHIELLYPEIQIKEKTIDTKVIIIELF